MEEQEARELDWRDYYAMLGVEPDADSKAITVAYAALARHWQRHDDGSEMVAERLRLVEEAYDWLSDPTKRFNYNKLYWTRRRKGPKAVFKSSLSQVLLVCPDCDRQNLYEFKQSLEKLRCPDCRAVFTSRAGKVKRMTFNRTGFRWYYFLSVIGLYDGKEQQVEFDADFKIEESDIRPGDNIALSYLGLEFAVIHNLTTNHYWRLVSPSTAH